MFKLIKLVIKLIVVLAIFLIGYNFFMGTPEERENSKAIVGQAKDLVGSVFGLLSSEKAKFSKGKYNGAFDRISNALGAAKDHASRVFDGGRQWAARLNQLEQNKQYLEQQLAGFNESGQAENNFAGQFSLEQFDTEFQRLAQETETILGEMQQGQ